MTRQGPYDKESLQGHKMRMSSETAKNVAESIAKVGKLVATEGLGIGIGALLFLMTGRIKTTDPLGVLRGNVVKAMYDLRSMLNSKIPGLDIAPMQFMEPFVRYYENLLANLDINDYSYYMAVSTADRASMVILIPAVVRTAIHMSSAILGRVVEGI